MTTETEARKFQTFDLYLSAFLSLHGVHPKLENVGGRVTFNFDVNDGLYTLMGRYNANEPIPVAAYATTAKALRSQMLSMKAGR